MSEFEAMSSQKSDSAGSLESELGERKLNSLSKAGHGGAMRERKKQNNLLSDL